MEMKKQKLLKITIDEWRNASRDKRELSVCRELGMDVFVLAKGNLEDRGRMDNVDGFDVIRYTTRPLGLHIPIIINRIASIFYFAHNARKIDSDIISGHDLAALLIGWLSSLFKKNKPKLVYDSHEFELGRAGCKRGRISLWYVRNMERFLMRRCAFSIMVNDVIADEVQRIHKLKDRPIVVRNIPNLWQIDKHECNVIRQDLLSQMEAPREMMLMYHGGVIHNRGIEMLLKVLSKNDNVCLVVLGNASSDYLHELQSLANNYGVLDRVVFHAAVPIHLLWKYVGASDIGMITIPAVSMSYYYMLPNKFFENIQSETPVICSDYPAISPLVKEYGVGLLCNPLDEMSINEAVEKLNTDKKLYGSCVENAKRAKEHLCWEKEKKVLTAAYAKLIQ